MFYFDAVQEVAYHVCRLGLLVSGLVLAAPVMASQPPASRTTDVLDAGKTPTTETNQPALGHPSLYQQVPAGPIVWPPAAPMDPARAAMAALDSATNEFEAPPLIVTRIAALPASSGLSDTQVVERFERNMLRERVTLADRLYRQGDTTNAIAMLEDMDRYLQNPRNRVLNLNRLAAYQFRRQQYDAAADLMRKATDLQKQDPVSKLNLAAVLITIGKLDEALNVLLEVYPNAMQRKGLMFSVHFNLACVYSLKAETGKALQNLAIAAQTDPASTAASLGDPQLDFIRADPRFAELVQAINDYLSRVPGR